MDAAMWQILFLFALGFFLFYGVYSARTANKDQRLLSQFGSRDNIIGLIVANVTLGTGFAYYVTAASQFGALIVVFPLGVFVGYYTLSRLIERWQQSFVKSGNIDSKIGAGFIIEIRDAFSDGNARRSKFFTIFVLLPLCFAYVFVFGFEIFVSSGIISSALSGGEAGLLSPWSVSVLLFFTVFIYSIFGGARATFSTDKIQLFGIVALVLCLLFYQWKFQGSMVSDRQSLSYPNLLPVGLTYQQIVALVFGFVAAVATQWFSMINSYISSNPLEGGATSKSLFRRSGNVSALVLLVIAGSAIGLTMSGTSSLSAFVSEISANADGTNLGSTIVSFVLLFGLISIVLSTADTIMIAVTQLLGEVFGISKRNGLRALMATVFLIAFVFMIYMFFIQPSVFYLLLSVASGPIVLAPFFACLMILGRRVKNVSSWLIVIIGVLFVSASFSGLLLAGIMPEMVPFLGLAHLLVSLGLSTTIWRSSQG